MIIITMYVKCNSFRRHSHGIGNTYHCRVASSKRTWPCISSAWVSVDLVNAQEDRRPPPNNDALGVSISRNGVQAAWRRPQEFHHCSESSDGIPGAPTSERTDGRIHSLSRFYELTLMATPVAEAPRLPTISPQLFGKRFGSIPI